MKQDKSEKSPSSVLEISMRAKALYLSTLPIIDQKLVRKYLQFIYRGGIATSEKVNPVANLLLIKFIWWYLKFFKSQSDNSNNFNLFKYALYSLFENNFKFSPEGLIDKVNKIIPEDIYETNWFEREIVNSVGKNEFGVLESISAISIENHLEIAKKIWRDIRRLSNNGLQDYVRNLTKTILQDFVSKVSENE